ncbi:hypothetical protein AVEN_93399-1 [Araneus ventricosus]|uniref:Uncharacterized protein n=1 Tax=Araneus ventricosus TaxID=182803 RepID=A0A4Y2ANX6_ARAVE|nr:hypothetical protein AVEN_93399-1 [Araneus ventricosus]
MDKSKPLIMKEGMPYTPTVRDDFNSLITKTTSSQLFFFFGNWRKNKRRLTLKEVPSPKPNEPNQTSINYNGTSAGIGDKEQIDVPNTDINEIQERDQTSKKARKVVANPIKWKCKARKIAHQTGKSYISKRGKNLPERKVKTFKNCNLRC